MLTLFAPSIALSLISAYPGWPRWIEFWGVAFGSMLLTPLIVIIILLVTDDVKQAIDATGAGSA